MDDQAEYSRGRAVAYAVTAAGGLLVGIALFQHLSKGEGGTVLITYFLVGGVLLTAGSHLVFQYVKLNNIRQSPSDQSDFTAARIIYPDQAPIELLGPFQELTSGTRKSLRQALSELVDDPIRINMVAQDADITTRHIDFRQAAQTIWFQVIAEAHKTGKLIKLCEAVISEYPTERLIELRVQLENEQRAGPARLRPELR